MYDSTDVRPLEEPSSETERRMVAARGWVGRGDLGVSVGKIKVLELGSGDGCIKMCKYLMPQNCALQNG